MAALMAIQASWQYAWLARRRAAGKVSDEVDAGIGVLIALLRSLVTILLKKMVRKISAYFGLAQSQTVKDETVRALARAPDTGRHECSHSPRWRFIGYRSVSLLKLKPHGALVSFEITLHSISGGSATQPKGHCTSMGTSARLLDGSVARLGCMPFRLREATLPSTFRDLCMFSSHFHTFDQPTKYQRLGQVDRQRTGPRAVWTQQQSEFTVATKYRNYRYQPLSETCDAEYRITQDYRVRNC